MFDRPEPRAAGGGVRAARAVWRGPDVVLALFVLVAPFLLGAFLTLLAFLLLGAAFAALALHVLLSLLLLASTEVVSLRVDLVEIVHLSGPELLDVVRC